MKTLLTLILLAFPCVAQPIPQNVSEVQRYTYAATVVSFYDADTLTLDINVGLGTWLRGEKVRLAGIDAPEIRGDKRQRGLAAKAFLTELLASHRKTVYVVTIKDRKEKYGRWLSVLLLEGYGGNLTNVNQALLKSGHAKPF